MLINWWKTRSTVRAINGALLQNGGIQVAKAKDHSKTNIHWYCFSTIDKQLGKKIRGSGAGFSDQMGIVRAWGEFVERYSFRNTAHQDASATTSNGFASHVDTKKAKDSALAELIERDVFLSCWLLKIPAQPINLSSLKNQAFNLHQIEKLKRDGFEVQMGLLGKCMGLFVGIVVVHSKTQLVISTSAKGSIEELSAHLTREAAVTVSDLKSSEAPQPIDTLTVDAEPMDHLKVYLNANAADFLKTWFQPQEQMRIFPDFKYAFDDLTTQNNYALQTGYFIFRAKSSDCQNLWFGTTRPEVVNLQRLRQIAGKQITYKEINHDPHPLA